MSSDRSVVAPAGDGGGAVSPDHHSTCVFRPRINGHPSSLGCHLETNKESLTVFAKPVSSRIAKRTTDHCWTDDILESVVIIHSISMNLYPKRKTLVMNVVTHKHVYNSGN